MNSASEFEPVAAPWVWSADEIAACDDWIVRLGADALDDIAAALKGVKQRNLALEDITAGDFPLPSMVAEISAVKRLLADGPGLCLVRGLPVEDYQRDDLALVLWGIGSHLGTAPGL